MRDPTADGAGVAEDFARDLADAVRYALDPPQETPISAAVYGGVAEDIPGVDEMLQDLMFQYLDATQDGPGA